MKSIFNDFEAAMDSLTGPTAPSLVQFTGSYDAVIAALFVDSGVAAAALPNGLQLLPDAQTPAGKHPLILTFGTQNDVLLKGVATPLNYLESVIGIPNVTIAGSNRAAIHLPRLDVNNTIALFLGLLVGFSKQLSAISDAPGRFEVLTPLSRVRILLLIYQAVTGLGKTSDFPKFDYVADLMQQPLISVDTSGHFLFTKFNWHLDSAKFQAVQATLNSTVNLPGLPSGAYSFDGFDSAIMGAGRLITSWDLSGPFFDWP